MDTIEGNKLIAEFMHSDSLPHRYDSSWDWLMPVVEKIESLDFEVSIYNSCCTIYAPDGQQRDAYVIPVADTNAIVGKGKIGSTWRSVVVFIGWYNSVTPSQTKD